MAITPVSGSRIPAATPPPSPRPAPSAPADTFTPSPPGDGIVSQKDMLALKARPPFTDQDLLAAIGRHDYAGLSDKMQGMADKREFVAKFHKQHKAEYEAMVADLRAGRIDSPSLKVAVALDTLKGTRWGSSGEGAKIVNHLDTLYDSGRITSADDPGGLGRTDLTTPGATGRDGSRSDSRVVLQQGLLDAPEAVAAVLAHEGQHSWRASLGKQQRSLHEEVDAHMAQNAVWGELGPHKYDSAAQPRGGALDLTARFDTQEKLYNHLASTYVQDDVDKGDRAAARGIVVDYMAYAQQHGFEPLHRLADDDLTRLAANAKSLVGPKSSADYVSAVENLQAEVSNRKSQSG